MSSLAPSTSQRPQARPSSVTRPDPSRGDRSDRNGNRNGSLNTVQKPLSFDIECSGLKPNTKHNFYYQNEDYTSYCKSSMQDLNIGTSTLQTDSSGSIKFKFQLTAKFQTEGSYTSLLIDAGDKIFELRAVNSSAKIKVPFKDY